MNTVAAKKSTCRGAAPLFFVPIKLSDSPLWLIAGGVRCEGDVGEEQGHFQRRHPQPAEGEQVGCSLAFFTKRVTCFIQSTVVIYK